MPWTSAMLLAMLPLGEQPSPEEFGAKSWTELCSHFPDEAVLTANDGSGRTITGEQYKRLAALLDEMDANLAKAKP